MIYTTERPIDPQKAHRLADALDAAGVAMLPPAFTYPEGVHDALRPVIQEVLGRNVGQNADWIDVAFNLGTGPANLTHMQCYLLEVEDRDGWYEIATHVQADEDDDALVPATHLGEEEVTVYAKELPALLREVRAGRSNPSRRRAPPPPPSHTFALEASAVQQGLFAPSSYEAKPKKRTVEPAPVDERQVDLFASPPPPKKNPRAAENGRYHYVMSCPGSTYEDIQALQESEQTVSRATFAKAIGSQAWRDIQASLGYDRDFPITKDWHVGYYKGVFRGVPCYFLRHSRIEYIYTLDGKLGPSLAGDDE